jgi:uncharacterized protein DUF397
MRITRWGDLVRGRAGVVGIWPCACTTLSHASSHCLAPASGVGNSAWVRHARTKDSTKSLAGRPAVLAPLIRSCVVLLASVLPRSAATVTRRRAPGAPAHACSLSSSRLSWLGVRTSGSGQGGFLGTKHPRMSGVRDVGQSSQTPAGLQQREARRSRPERGASEMGWRRSSYCSGANSTCVEVAVGAVTLVRDAKRPDGPVLCFGSAAWRVFLRGRADRLY